MSSILILDINAPEPDLSLYQPLRQTRRFKYYSMINNPNVMEIEQITNASDDMLSMFENAFSNMHISGGKRKTRKNKRKSRKSRKSRRY